MVEFPLGDVGVMDDDAGKILAAARTVLLCRDDPDAKTRVPHAERVLHRTCRGALCVQHDHLKRQLDECEAAPKRWAAGVCQTLVDFTGPLTCLGMKLDDAATASPRAFLECLTAFLLSDALSGVDVEFSPEKIRAQRDKGLYAVSTVEAFLKKRPAIEALKSEEVFEKLVSAALLAAENDQNLIRKS